MTDIKHMTTVTVGAKAGTPRIWLEGKWLLKSGFEPGTAYEAEVDNGEMVLHLSSRGKRKVSTKKGDIPVLDVNNQQVAETFGASKVLRVVAGDRSLRISQTRVMLLVRSRVLVPRAGSLFTGGGFLDHAAKLAGFEPVFGVEVNPSYADIAVRNHQAMTMFNASVEEVDPAEMAAFRPLGALVMGVPCEPYSRIRRLDRGGQEKRDKKLPPEAHELGDMFVWGLRAAEAANAHTVVIEEVPPFLESAAFHVTRSFLARLGYTVDARLIDPLEYGEVTGRKRAVIVATTGPRVNWPEPSPLARKLADYLDPGPHEWWDRKTKPWPFEHWEAQTAKGNGFAPPILTANDTRVPTIKKRYFAGQGDNPVVAHPTKKGTCRWFTLDEVKRIHGIPDGYDLAGPKTTAGEVIGQGVLVDLFRRIVSSACSS